MNIDLDNPNLTAFALGELSGADRDAVAQAIAGSPEAQAHVEEIQTFAQLVAGEFRLDLQRAARKRLSILSLLEQGNFWSERRWVSLAAAAVLAICALVAAVALSPQRRPAVLAEQQGQNTRRDRIVQMEVDPAPPQPIASSAAPVEIAAAGGAQASDRRTGEDGFAPAAANPVSSFPVQVSTASYANVRRAISSGSRPAKEAVRIEEMINYFSYDYPQPEGDRAFSIHLDAATCPWQPGNQLVRIGLKGREIPNENRGASNLVFLLDVSGSMESADRLPLMKNAMRLLVDRLTEKDRVAIVVYAGASGVALPPTPGDRKEEILRALDDLQADALSGRIEGIELAYRIAAENFIKGGVNRVIVGTDGELSVGVADERELVKLAKKKMRTGVGLTLFAVGDDNERNAAMQKVAEKVSGNYALLDSLENARRALVQQINGTLVTIAKDVEVEVAFNPARVASYRLIGYENRIRRQEESSSAEHASAEVGAGHTVTALYEVVPAGAQPDSPIISDARPGELVTVKLHHKDPANGAPMLTEHSLDADVVEWPQAPADLRFAAAVAQFGMILRDSPHKGNGTLAGVLETAQEAQGADPAGYRAGFVDLVRRAQTLAF